ncbi:MAG: putative toxin-antitoxin system toxin component, PIN family [Candidatus Rokubacteria bacterium]|nr:putative toxin-antitoxin system toxin component, PIN family [Candidatus Rokubacteria bacterium]
MRAVLDTNVIVSAVLIRRGNERRLLDLWREGAFDLIASPPLLEELGRVFSYSRIRRARWMTDDEIVELLELIATESLVVEGASGVKASRDPGDDMVLAAAIGGEADYIVSGDRDLLILRTYRAIPILRPAAFLAVLTRAQR